MIHFNPGARYSKAELLVLLRRIGCPPEQIAEIDSKLPDWIDPNVGGPLLQSYAVTLDEVVNRLGGSP
jgi:hypothetical protein